MSESKTQMNSKQTVILKYFQKNEQKTSTGIFMVNLSIIHGCFDLTPNYVGRGDWIETINSVSYTHLTLPTN